MTFLTSFFAWIKSLLSVFSDGLDKSTNKLEKHRENKLDVGVVLASFKKQATAKLKEQNDILDTQTANLKSRKNDLHRETQAFENSVRSLFNVNKELLKPDLTSERREELEEDKPFIMLESRVAKRRASVLEQMVQRGDEHVKGMRKSIRENDLKARTIISELEDLSMRKDLVDSYTSIDSIKLAGDYSIDDIMRIVEGKENFFEAKQENDRLLNRNDNSVVDQYAGDNSEFDADIEAMLDKLAAEDSK